MKLFGLPFVPLKEILDHLDLSPLLFLSLCSKRTKNVIVRTQKYEFQKVDFIEYVSNGHQVAFEQNMVSGRAITFMCLFDSNGEDFSIYPYEYVTLNELGAPIKFLRCPADLAMCQNLHVIYNTGDAQLVIELILKHVLDLIGHHTKFRVKGRFPDGNLVPRFRNIQSSNMVTVGDFKSEDLDEFLDRATSLEYLAWCSPRVCKYTPLRDTSRLYELHTLYLWTESSVASNVMKNFNGRHLFLLGLITATDVVQFLNAWKSGQKFRNLEIISMNKEGFEIPEIRNAVQLKEVSAEVEYSFVRKYPHRQSHPSIPYPWELKSRFYMVRESDDHVATVILAPSRVFMGVWNMTEQEFLDKFHNV